jgi:phosphomannomutase
VTPDSSRFVAERWLAAEPDDDIRAELQALLDGPEDELAARFSGRLMFGTAGLRAAVGAGPLRMNRLVIRQAARGLADHVLELDATARDRGVVIGYDARRKSDVFALDSARVMAAAGMRVHLLPVALPTPVLAWAVTELGCAAGVMVTASHNPPADNGYKVYLADGAQIVPPHDTEIADRIAAVDPTNVPMSGQRGPLIVRLPQMFVDGYIDSMRAVRMRPAATGVSVAYTPLHGVGGEVALRAFEAAGLPEPYVVAEQAAPDPTFPTVSFPNPEEPGAMDLVIELAREVGASLALANDPDADRLGAAIPQPDGSWRRLGGDEIGWLFADHLLTNSAPGPNGEDRLVVTTLVSSSLLSTMAADYGVHFAETFTGFKWMARAALDRPHLRLLFAYEQALGYLVTSRPLDKDGISAAVVLAEIAAVAAAEGTTIEGRLDDIAARYGRHVVGERSLRMTPLEGAALVRGLQDDPPSSLLDVRVADVRAYPEADLLRFVLEGGIRIQVRPSGTEPKVKLYGEAVDADPGPFLDALAARLQSG